MSKTIIVLMVLVAASCQSRASFKEGDIIFHISLSAQSEAIQRATKSKYSHVGLILYRDGNPYVFEAVNPVKFTPLQEWLKRGKGRHYVVKRLKNPDALLTDGGLRKLYGAAQKFEGKPYDLTFEWSDDRIYCSELVWKIYDEAFGVKVGELQKLSAFNLNDPVVKQKLKERYGDRIPINETVVSPQAIFESKILETVGRG